MATQITALDVVKIAQLANLTISEDEKKLFADQFSQTIKVIDQLSEVDTQGISPTTSVSNQTNITRSDKIDLSRVLTQAEALSGAKNVHHGFFVVKQILEKDSE